MAAKKTSPKLPKNSTKAAPKVDSAEKPDPSGSLVKAERPLSNAAQTVVPFPSGSLTKLQKPASSASEPAAQKTPPPATPDPSGSLKV